MGASPKTSDLAIGSLVCGLLGFLWLPALIGVILGIMAIRQVNRSNGTVGGKGLAIGGLVVSSLALAGTTVAILFFVMLDNSLSGAKMKANRVKCKNNLKTIHQAMIAFGGDIEESSPHLFHVLGGNDHWLAKANGYNSNDDVYDVERWMGAFTMRKNLNETKTLVSPLDAKAIAAHDRFSMKHFAEAREKPLHIPRGVQSYAIAMQGDLKASETVLAMTRNISDAGEGDRENYIRAWGGRNDREIWKYPPEDRSYDRHKGAAHITGRGNKQYDSKFIGQGDSESDIDKFGIEHLETGQGNWITAGGATSGGSEAEFNMQLNAAEDSFPEGDAISTGLNLIILRPHQ